MTSRTVAVILQAEIGSYVAGMTKAATVTKGFGETAETSTKKASSGFDLAGKGSILMGAAIVGALVAAVNKAADFEKSMSAVQAATQASAGTMEQLRQAALKAGADTKYSATEAADGITEMAKAGVSAKDIIGGGLTGVLSLAAAGEIQVADAAGIASTAMVQFGLSGSQIPHVADLLAAGAGKAMGSVDDMGQALNQAGLIAANSGATIEETTGTLAAFASAGLIGSDAGTSFKTMLQQLQAPSHQSAQLMSELGISAYDAQGNFVGLAGLAEQLKTHLGGLTQAQRDNALATIFGTDASRAATVLYREGAQGIQEWTNKVNDSGYAARQAHDLQNNLTGDLERLGGAAEKLATTLGGVLIGPLREVTQLFGGLVSGAGTVAGAFSNLSPEVQVAIGAMLAWAVAGGKVTGAFDSIGQKFQTFRDEQQVQRALYAAQSQGISDVERAFGGLGSGVDNANQKLSAAQLSMRGWDADLAASASSIDNVGTSAQNTGYKAATAKAAIGEFAKAIGPELGIAVLAGGVALLASDFDKIVHAGQGARDEIDAIDKALDGMGSAGRVQATAGYIDQLRHSLEETQNVISSGGGDQGWFANLLGPSAVLAGRVAAMQDATLSAEALRAKIAELKVEQQNTADSTMQLSRQYGISSSEVQNLADKYGIDLTKSVTVVSQKFIDSGAAAELAAQGIAAVGNTAGMTQGQIDAAAKAVEDWLGQLAQIGTAFVDPLNTYQQLLQDKTAAEQASAQATADATQSSKDSWKDYVGSVSVSLDEYAAKLEEQITNQENWRANLVTISSRGGYEVAQILAQMGQQGADIVAQMANSTDADFQRMAAALIADANLGGSGAASALDTQMKVMAAVGAAGAAATVQGIAAQLGIGADTVRNIAAQFGRNLAEGVNPLLAALGKPQVMTGVGRAPGQAVGFAGGGWTGPGTKYTPVGVVHADEFVFNKEQVASAGGPSAMYALASAIGRGYAGGGYVSAASVPHPSSTEPFRAPLSSGGQGAMSTEYDAVTAWVTANPPFVAGAAAGKGGGAVRWTSLVLQALSMMSQPSSLLGSVLRRMNQESGGNQFAINLWDSNAKRGTPSKGLMQVIDPTFRSYHDPRTSWDIYDPLANVLASMRYALGRYGSLSAAYNKLGGYADGTDYVPADGLAFLHEGEAVIPAAQNLRSREMSGSGWAGGAGGAPVVVSITGAKIVGTLDLGGGLEARIDAVVVGALNEATTRGRNNPR